MPKRQAKKQKGARREAAPATRWRFGSAMGKPRPAPAMQRKGRRKLVEQPVYESLHWQEICGFLGGDCPLLRSDPLYALPKELIEELQKHVPGLLEDLAEAEECLSRFCQEHSFAGFQHRRPFSHTLLSRRDRSILKSQELGKYARAVSKGAKGIPPNVVRQQFGSMLVAAERMQSYLGWLVTERAYRQELASLREAGKDVLIKVCEAPSLNYIPHEKDLRRIGAGIPKEAAAFLGDYRQFCRRWCLQRLVTWDLPQLRNPAWAMSAEQFGEDVPAGGVLLFVPYSFIPHGLVDLSGIAGSTQKQCAPAHLRGWLDSSSTGRMGEGADRFAALFLFDFYWNVLQDRHGERANRRKTKIKAALGAYLVGAEGWTDVLPGKAMADKLYALRRKRLRL